MVKLLMNSSGLSNYKKQIRPCKLLLAGFCITLQNIARYNKAIIFPSEFSEPILRIDASLGALEGGLGKGGKVVGIKVANVFRDLKFLELRG